MALEFCILASGSKGNSTLVRSDHARILLDAGLTARQLALRLESVGETAEQINAVVITHAHTDHVSGVAEFAKKFNIPVYAPYSVAQGMMRSKVIPHLRPFDGGDFFIEDMTVSPFGVPHDVPCYGYSFYCAGSKISVLTDLGAIPKNVLSDVSDSDAVVLEANHDEALLNANPRYPQRLKNRILGTHGHLSNIACACGVESLARSGVKQVVLAHLSEQNNDPLLALTTVREKLSEVGLVFGRDILVDVAKQETPTKFFSIE